MSKALTDIAAERQRQIEEEGWTPAHDDRHTSEELARAASCYALGSSKSWPWHHSWWKPKDRRADLVRAGALIAAEIDRLDRLEERGFDPRPPDPPPYNGPKRFA